MPPGALLVVDDEKLIRAFLCDLLSDVGLDALAASNRAEALRWRHRQPAVLITDLWLGAGMNGRQ